MPKLKPYAVHWFRRDLRMQGNPALTRAARETDGRVLGLFCFDSKFLARDDFSPGRFAFFLETLCVLRDELREKGGDLLFLDEGPFQTFPKLLKDLESTPVGLPSLWTWNRDYEPFARERDMKMGPWLQERGIKVATERDHLLIEPTEIKSGTGSFYQVFTPFKHTWMKALLTKAVQERIEAQTLKAPSLSLTWQDVLPELAEKSDKLLETYRTRNLKQVPFDLPPAGNAAALKQLTLFKKQRVEGYGEARDIPSVAGTSQLSIYFKNGSITTARVIAELGLLDVGMKEESDRAKYLSELAWREFYYHILYHRPDVESGPFLKKYASLNWENDEEHFVAWQEGKTGYPIVDAGMRQLKTTGWMHNRVRMIVASFLTKDLLIDWRWGEKHFMKLLLDGDLAPNNGGWQWAASTGCDPQPYFRIFNPSLQSKRFDPNGEYIRRYIPELKSIPSKFIHEPWKSPNFDADAKGYPRPIVDHAARKVRALKLYSSF